MYLRPQGREPQRSKHLRKEDTFIPNFCWFLSNSGELSLALTSKAGTLQTDFIETEVITHPVGEGGAQAKINMREMRKGHYVTFLNTPLQRACGGGNENQSFQKQKSKIKTPPAPTSTQKCAEEGSHWINGNCCHQEAACGILLRKKSHKWVLPSARDPPPACPSLGSGAARDLVCNSQKP